MPNILADKTDAQLDALMKRDDLSDFEVDAVTSEWARRQGASKSLGLDVQFVGLGRVMREAREGKAPKPRRRR